MMAVPEVGGCLSTQNQRRVENDVCTIKGERVFQLSKSLCCSSSLKHIWEQDITSLRSFKTWLQKCFWRWSSFVSCIILVVSIEHTTQKTCHTKLLRVLNGHFRLFLMLSRVNLHRLPAKRSTHFTGHPFTVEEYWKEKKIFTTSKGE